jgi:hypothetical protein
LEKNQRRTGRNSGVLFTQSRCGPLAQDRRPTGMAARVQRRTRWRSCGCGEAQRWWCDSDGKWRRSGSCSPCMDGKTARSLTGARGRGRRRRRAATAWLDELNGDWCSSDLHVVGNGVRRGGWRRMKQLRRRWQLFLDYGPLPGLHWRP